MARVIFICHAVEDRELANALVAGLEAEGLACWVAPRDVMVGADYAQGFAVGKPFVLAPRFPQAADTDAA